ncbi:glycoside hydrolase family 25 protein [Aquimarina brevivitae]|uniref:Lysozyme n=1 Tax=Aquimarina brevivitae TaxID=323412 RepID=A0A4Q7PJE8_9FLAO|nr:GH25 family lysozyme [Aquimarina brevivitae]RZS99032.1 lysozyme [Aquimarina brevivitae]
MKNLVILCLLLSIVTPSCKDTYKPEQGPILGIDVSHFQGEVDWKTIKNHNISFAYAKATQGTHFVDPKFKENQKNTKLADLKHGSYHFYISNENPALQAEHYIKTIQDLEEGQMLPMLDLEMGGMKGSVSIAQFQEDVIKWLTIVEEKLGARPIIYTNNPFANKYLDHPKFAKYHLWLAEYGVKNPRTPKTWKQKGWAIWQRSEKGTITGAHGQVDHDIVNETYSLKDLTHRP